MAFDLFGAKPSPESALTYYKFNIQEQLSVKFKSLHKLFCQENAFENIFCEVLAILC